MFNLLHDKIHVKIHGKWYTVQDHKKYTGLNYTDCTWMFPDGIPFELAVWVQEDPVIIKFLEFMFVSKYLGIE